MQEEDGWGLLGDRIPLGPSSRGARVQHAASVSVPGPEAGATPPETCRLGVTPVPGEPPHTSSPIPARNRAPALNSQGFYKASWDGRGELCSMTEKAVDSE